ncbi:uncharacterized protein GGS22DRAFT_175649 [Annulohypoxylon maeteangense]|uniref:uncharacterized protein n=1 Tax=Annulohypoxylon maeteangense TaxID=1927788 RepID=UPI0020075BD3|nr:uncharacterized protein GGS22DRAFT_175649 [Annulohypoxylon maeteangense]KAI0880147.1 hypothetical protein GGS22DRAFT_175649 [Annulohypoxylon maeteangense]
MDSSKVVKFEEAPEGNKVDLIKKGFELDVMKRAIDNTAARNPCPCGMYQYYSQKCGHLYKKIHLKCGRSTSKKTGDAILCSAGRLRRVDVETAMVPFHCSTCRQSGIRWIGRSDIIQNANQEIVNQPSIKQKGEANPSSLVEQDQEGGQRGQLQELYRIPEAPKSSPSQLHNALPFRGYRDQKENVKVGLEASKEPAKEDGEEIED